MKRPQHFLSYGGAKIRLSEMLPRPMHETIIEGFAGSGSYSWVNIWRNKNLKVKLVELNQDLLKAWSFLLQQSKLPLNKRTIKYLPTFDEGIYKLDNGKYQDIKNLTNIYGDKLSEIEYAYLSFITVRGSFYSQPRPTVGAKLQWTKKQSMDVNNNIDIFKNFEIFESQVNRSTFLDILPKKEKVTLFLDPPYQCVADKRGKRNTGAAYGGSKNKILGSQGVNYQQLAEDAIEAASQGHQVIVTEYNSSEWINDLEKLAGEKNVPSYKRNIEFRGYGAKQSKEVVWSNHEIIFG